MGSGEKIRLSAADELIPPDLYLFLLAIDTPDYEIEFVRDPTADAVIAHLACLDPDALPPGAHLAQSPRHQATTTRTRLSSPSGFAEPWVAALFRASHPGSPPRRAWRPWPRP